MKFEYIDLYEAQFEDLVIAVCQKILGIGVKGFAKGPDGGRDARFVGTAEKYPSVASPLGGKVIIQAKHTDDPIAKFSDSDFSSDAKSSILSVEMKKVKALMENDELDHYFIFSNRKLTADAESKIMDRFKDHVGLESVHVVGVEALDTFMRDYPQVREKLNINPVDTPLRVSPEEIANVIVTLSNQKEEIASSVKKKELLAKERTSFTDKNIINGLSEDYANWIIKNYLKDFSLVETFLENPANESIYEDYKTAVDEFNCEIIEHKAEYHTFDNLLNYLCAMLFKRDRDLAGNKRLTKLVIYYMYWICDLGQDKHA